MTANRLVAPGATPRPRKRPTAAEVRRRQRRNRSLMTVLLCGALLAGLGTAGGYGIGRGVDWVRAIWPDPPVELLAEKVAPPEALDPAGVAEACTPEAVALDLAAEGSTFTLGDSVDLTLRVTNEGRVPCLVDSASSSMQVVVTDPDGERVWSSADCSTSGGEEAMLAPGWNWEIDARWGGTTSSPGCEGESAKVSAGTYTATMVLGDVPDAEGDPVDITVEAPPKPKPKPKDEPEAEASDSSEASPDPEASEKAEKSEEPAASEEAEKSEDDEAQT